MPRNLACPFVAVLKLKSPFSMRLRKAGRKNYPISLFRYTLNRLISQDILTLIPPSLKASIPRGRSCCEISRVYRIREGKAESSPRPRAANGSWRARVGKSDGLSCGRTLLSQAQIPYFWTVDQSLATRKTTTSVPESPLETEARALLSSTYTQTHCPAERRASCSEMPRGIEAPDPK